MINEFDHVKIKTNGIIGEVVDVYVSNEEKIFVVESDKKGVPGGYGNNDSWKLCWCLEEQLEKIE